MPELRQVDCETDSNLYRHAERELALIGPIYDGMVNKAALDIVGVFAAQGHSGLSAKLTTGLVERLMRFEPLQPLTGEDSEWNDVGNGEQQNNRCSHVFKCADGAYDIDTPSGQPDGIGNGGWSKIEFPYIPGDK
jgi:hypothetical protein